MRLLVADDHAITRAGIRYALEGQERITVVGEAETGPKVLPLVGRTSPDVVLLDIDMPGLDGLTCLERMQTRYPDVAVIMLAVDASPAQVQAAFARGARGWILKTIDPQELGPAIKHAREADVRVPYGPVRDDDAPARAAGLSGRELDILRPLGRGSSNKEIAAELDITVQTVKFHLTNIYRKLRLSNRTAAARWAREAGLVSGTSRTTIAEHTLRRT
jgi:DNA-binding NarL/FixJ family response regulator